ncbi:DNA-formamidopyrimidine glycosylase, partial [Plectonema cf. radiosum LEGE 06105]
MPELPEVETVRRGLNQLTLKRKITGGDVLLDRTIAYPFSAEEFLNGIKESEILCWHRRGKYLIAELTSILEEDKDTRGQGDKLKKSP